MPSTCCMMFYMSRRDRQKGARTMAKKKKNKSTVSDALKAAERQARLQAMADSGGRRAQRAVTFKDRRKEASRKACRGKAAW